MNRLFTITAVIIFAATPWIQAEGYPRAKVNYDDYKGLVKEAEGVRAERLVDLNTFLEMSRKPGVIILDTRSADRYQRIHVKGARHLAFTDFAQARLAEVIPSFDTKILIYCNNNFQGNQVDFITKVAVPTLPVLDPITTELSAQRSPLMMALNIPTYLNLYGYGYKNVYELDELVVMKDPRIAFEGSMVPQR